MLPEVIIPEISNAESVFYKTQSTIDWYGERSLKYVVTFDNY